MSRTTLLLALLLALLTAPATAAGQVPLLTHDAGPEEWSDARDRMLVRSIEPLLPGTIFRTFVDGELVDKSSARSLPWSFDDGEHVVRLEADVAGLPLPLSATRTVRVDTTPPDASLAAPSRTAAREPFTATIDASDAGSGVAAMALSIDGEQVGTTPVTQLELPAGTHRLLATVTDALGHTTTDAATVVVGRGDTSRESATLCGPPQRGARCQEGGGRRTPGGKGTGKVSHKGWPAITGILWIADNRGRTRRGTHRNDELLGGHGDDKLWGGPGRDVLWGDQWPTGNTPRQRDVLHGGPGRDFIYASHGRNRVTGGGGNDVIWAYFVHGFNRIDAGPGNDEIWEHSGTGIVDCGPGRDIVHTRMGGAWRVRNCETIRHYCAFGENKDGSCKKAVPGAKRVSPREQRGGA